MRALRIVGLDSQLHTELAKSLGFEGAEETLEMDFSIQLVQDVHIEKEQLSKTILYLTEPKAVRPDLYITRTLSQYLGVITISKTRAFQIGTQHYVPLPVTDVVSQEKIKTNVRLRRICLVAGAKFSANKESNYGLRRKVLLEDKHGLIDLYGPDWLDPTWLELKRRFYAMRQQRYRIQDYSFRENMGQLFRTYRNYKGLMDAQFSQLNQYEMCLVIENQSDYLSEKIWIAMSKGVVPIYVGDYLDEDPNLDNCLIRAPKDSKEILSIIGNVSKHEISTKRRLASEYLKSSNFKNRSLKSVANRLARKIGEISHVNL